VWNVPGVVLFDEFLLSRRTFPIEVDDDEVNPTPVLFVETYGAASLPLGIESTLSEHENVIGLASDGPVLKVIAGNQRPVLAVTRIVKPRIQPQVLGGVQVRGHTKPGSYQD
jgi:hypothetical protein